MARSGLCVGCGACAAASGPSARMSLDAYGQLKPAGAWRKARDASLASLCPFSPHARDEDVIAGLRFPQAPYHDGRLGRFEATYVGYAAEGQFRERGSSGGMATWTAHELLRLGLVDGVVHVAPQDRTPDGRFFAYTLSTSAEEVQAGAKSRYHPVELSGVIEAIRAGPGRYAVVGVPCFIKAIHLLRAQDEVLAGRIAFTLGLFCGHMKSTRMAESFAWQMGRALTEVAALDYRAKDAARPANWYAAELQLADGGVARKDWWGMVDGDWGAGFFQNAACDFCDDVVAETADISFGDAWVEPYSSDGRGTNVVVVRSRLLRNLVERARCEGRLSLDPVDAEFVAQTQAAGFRQRREGLALRLAETRGPIRPRKRVAPQSPPLSRRRRAIYHMRRRIARWSHRVFWLARLTRTREIYLHWARLELAAYQGVTYSRGRVGAWADRYLFPNDEQDHSRK